MASLLSACGSTPPETSAEQQTSGTSSLQIKTRRQCPSPGNLAGSHTVLTVTNTADTPVTLYISGEDNQEAYSALERVGSSAVRQWEISLPDGRWHVHCVFQGKASRASDAFKVTGSSVSPDTVQHMEPVTQQLMTQATLAHAARYRSLLPRWVSRDDALLRAIASGDRHEAQEAWVTAYLEYRKFSDSATQWPEPADEIAAFSSEEPSEKDAPPVTGYHRLEWGLWHSEPLNTLLGEAQENNRRIHEVVDHLGNFAISAPDYGLRAHEVSEELERYELVGLRDYGAHVTAGTVLSTVESTRSTVEPLRSILTERGYPLDELDTQLNHTTSVARSLAEKYDRVKAFSQWEPGDRAELISAVARQNELLATVATMTVVRRMT